MQSKVFCNCRIIALAVFFVQAVVFPVSESGASEVEVALLVEKFVHNVKSGDTEGMLELMTAPMLHERKTLLERNNRYPAILVDAYKNTTFDIEQIDSIDAVSFSVVVGQFSNDELMKRTKFICKKDGDSWKISEEFVVN